MKKEMTDLRSQKGDDYFTLPIVQCGIQGPGRED